MSVVQLFFAELREKSKGKYSVPYNGSEEFFRVVFFYSFSFSYIKGSVLVPSVVL